MNIKKFPVVKHCMIVAAVCVCSLTVAFFMTAEGFEAYSDTYTEYTEGITEGAIYFDESTGTITDCDETVTSAAIPEEINGVKVVKIGEDAFKNCENLENIEFPETLQTIESSAFYNCHMLQRLYIGKNITDIKDTFDQCSSLISIDVDTANKEFCSEDGILFNKSKDTIIKYPASKPDTKYLIPDSVSAIGSAAFSYCRYLEEITIQHTVKEMGDHSFAFCKVLDNVVIPASVKNLPTYAFYYCDGLKKITISEGITSIGKYAFGTCNSLTGVVIPESVITIDDGAFSHCASLGEITIPSTTKNIGVFAFHDCPNLEFLGEVNSAAEKYAASNNIVFISSQMVKYEIADGYIYFDKSTGTVKDCSINATSAVIPNQIANITVKSIGKCAFDSCKLLTNVTLPEGIITIEDEAFDNCSALTEITIPVGVRNIGANVLRNCYSMTDIMVAEENQNYASENGVLFDKAKKTLIQYPDAKNGTGYEIPEGIATIGEGAFSNCKLLEKVTIPGTVEKIERSAFASCVNLKQAEIPDSVISIGAYAFDACSSIAYLKLSNNITEIPENMISQGFALKELHIPQKVHIIRSRAFEYCQSLKNVEIPDNVVNIGSRAFGNCSCLEAAIIGGSAVYFANDVFINCTGLTIYGEPDSKTESYAVNSGFSFKPISDADISVGSEKKHQMIKVETNFNKVYGSDDFALDASAQTHLEYESSDPSVAEVSGDGIVSINSAGTVTITVKAEETEQYEGASSKVTIAVAKACQPSYAGTASYTKTYGAAPFEISIPAKTKVDFATSNPSVAAIYKISDTKATVKIKSGGTATITAKAAENENYKSKEYIIKVNVNKASQSITCKSGITKSFAVNSYFYLNAKAKTKLTYKSSNSKIATVSSSGKVIMKNPGKVTFTVYAASTGQYKGTTKKVTFTSNLKKPALTAKAYSGRKIKLTWSKVPGANGYKVYIYDKSKKKYICRLNKKSSVKSVTHQGLKAGKTYIYKVRAYRMVNGKTVYSPYSSVRKATARK